MLTWAGGKRAVVGTRPGDVIRIISARMATRRETELFLEYKGAGHV